WTLGFDQLAESTKAFTPARVEEITGVDAKALREAAALIATNTPTALFTFIGLAMSGNVTNTMRALGLILAITGNVDRVGSNFIKSRPRIIGRGFAGEKAFAVPEELLKRQLSADKFPLLAGPFAVTPYPHPLDVIAAMETGKPYPVKALLTCC